MKYFIRIFVILFLINNLYFPKANNQASQVIVYVNDDLITKEDFEQFKKLLLIHSGRPLNTKLTQNENKQILDEYILILLKIQEAKSFCKNLLKQKYFITPKDVTNMMSNVFESNNLTLKEYLTKLAKANISENLAKLYWEAFVAWNKYVQYVFGAMSQPTDKEIFDLIKKQKETASEDIIQVTRVALVTPSEEEIQELSYLSYNASNTKDFLESVKNKLKSANISKSEKLPIKHIDHEFAKFLNQYKVGSITQPIPVENGIVLFCIEKKFKIKQPPLTEDTAKNILFERKLAVFADRKIKEIKRTAYIKYAKTK